MRPHRARTWNAPQAAVRRGRTARPCTRAGLVQVRRLGYT